MNNGSSLTPNETDIIKSVFTGSFNAMNDLFNVFLEQFNPINDENDSSVGCFGCAKNSKGSYEHYQKRRVRAASQSRLRNGDYFRLNTKSTRAKSREFKQITPQVKIVRAKSSSSNRRPSDFGRGQNSNVPRPVRPGSSHDIATENSSKPFSKLQTSTKDSNKKSNNSGKSSKAVQKSRNSKNLVIVMEETEQNMKSDSNLPEPTNLYK